MKHLKHLLIFNEKVRALITLAAIFFLANVLIIFSSKQISEEWLTHSLARHIFNIPNIMSAMLLLTFNLCCILLAHFMAMLNYQTALLSLNTLFNQCIQHKLSPQQLPLILKEKHPECEHLVDWASYATSELVHVEDQILAIKEQLRAQNDRVRS